MSQHTRTTTLKIESTADDILRVLDTDFVNTSEWAPEVISSDPNPETPDGVNGSAWGGRVCQVVGLGQTDERIVAFDSDTRTLSYTVQAEKLPPALTHMQNTWTVNMNGASRSMVDIRLDATIDDDIMNQAEAARFVDQLFKGVGGSGQSLKSFVESMSDPERQRTPQDVAAPPT